MNPLKEVLQGGLWRIENIIDYDCHDTDNCHRRPPEVRTTVPPLSLSWVARPLS